MINERFEEAIEELYDLNYFLAAEITKLGYPKLVKEEVPTAGVMWDDKKKKVIFLFNEDFEKKLDDKEFAFVVAHEAMHLLNMHIFYFQKKHRQLKRKNKKNHEIWQAMRKLNVAADCIANDSLTNLYNMPRLESLAGMPLFYGKNVVNFDCHDMTLEDVYNILPETKEKDCSHLWSSFLNSDGSINEGFADSIKEFLSENGENSSLSDEESIVVDDMVREFKNNYAGKNIEGKIRSILDLTNNSLKWDKLIKEMVEIKAVTDVWTRPHRKLGSIYPDVILPSIIPIEREEIFIAIDTSGSIDQKACDLFVSVVRSTPKRFKVSAISFDTACYEYDIRKDENPKGGGGTDFQIIENYIQNNLKKYPKAIFVLTDGYGTPLKVENSKKWCWLLYGGCCTDYVKDMKHYEIMNLLNKSS